MTTGPSTREQWAQLSAELWNADLEEIQARCRGWLEEMTPRWGAQTIHDLRLLRAAADALRSRDPDAGVAAELHRSACELAVRLTGAAAGGPLRVWLDDDPVDRAPGVGWLQVFSAWEAIGLLATGRVSELSLDHDLADDDRAGRGRDVTYWLAEEQGLGRIWWPAGLHIHTANPAGNPVMDGTIMSSAQEHFEIDREIDGAKIHYRLSRLAPELPDGRRSE